MPITKSTYLTNTGYLPPTFFRRMPPLGQAKADSIEDFTPSPYIDDNETVTHTLKLGIAELIIAEAVADGHIDEYFSPTYCYIDQQTIKLAWHFIERFYPYLEIYSWMHGFPYLVNAAEKILYENGLYGRSPWSIKIEEILRKDILGQASYQQCKFSLPLSAQLLPLPGEQGWCLEVFSHWHGTLEDGRCYSHQFPLRGITPAVSFAPTKFMPIPWEHYLLYGLDELHHSGKKQVYLTPSLAEALINRNNPNAVVVSWMGGVETIDLVDFEPLKGHSVVYILNPNTFFTAQEAIDCLVKVREKLEEMEITPKVAAVNEVPNRVNSLPPGSKRLDIAKEIFCHTK